MTFQIVCSSDVGIKQDAFASSQCFLGCCSNVMEFGVGMCGMRVGWWGSCRWGGCLSGRNTLLFVGLAGFVVVAAPSRASAVLVGCCGFISIDGCCPCDHPQRWVIDIFCLCRWVIWFMAGMVMVWFVLVLPGVGLVDMPVRILVSCLRAWTWLSVSGANGEPGNGLFRAATMLLMPVRIRSLDNASSIMTLVGNQDTVSQMCTACVSHTQIVNIGMTGEQVQCTIHPGHAVTRLCICQASHGPGCGCPVAPGACS